MKSIIAAFLLSILPVYAILEVINHIEAKYVLGYLALIFCITLFVYHSDKKKAQADEWRTPEKTLHLLELAGGWPAAFIAQRKFRHKIRKAEYQYVFWLIALAHNYLAFDFINEWHYTLSAFEFIEPFMR